MEQPNLKLNKKDQKVVEKRKKEIIANCKVIFSKELAFLQIVSKSFKISSQKRLEFDIETGSKIPTGSRYVLIETTNRKIIFDPKDFTALKETLNGVSKRPFILQTSELSFSLGIIGNKRVRPLNFLHRGMETLQCMLDEIIKLSEDLESSE